MRSAELVRALEERELDGALVRADVVPRTLRSKPLFSVDYRLFVPVALETSKMDAKGLLSRLPLALPSGGQFRARFAAACAKAGVEPNLRLECPSVTLAAQAVASGHYASVLPDLAESAFSGTGVRDLPVPIPGLPPRRIALAWHPRISALHEKVIQQILNT